MAKKAETKKTVVPEKPKEKAPAVPTRGAYTKRGK